MTEIDLTPTQALVHNLYKDEKGMPILLSKGQDVIYQIVAQKTNSRAHIMCHTRFGKSMTVGLAALTRAATFPEKWAIVAGTKDKAKIIMDVVIAHIFDNEFTQSRFTPESGDNLDDIRRYRNKSRVTFLIGTKTTPVGSTGQVYDKTKLYGEITVGSAKEALGYGAQNVIEDESALISDSEHSLVMRMLGDNPDDNFLCKIGNPFTRGHFLDSYHDPKYRKVIIDCYKALHEGRMTQEIIDENSKYPFFKILYECKFPSASEVDESGWQYLLTDTDIRTSEARVLEPGGERKLGIDVSRGGRNYNVWVLRNNNTAEVLKKTQEHDLIPVLEDTMNILREQGIAAGAVYVDDTGVGGGLTDMLKMRGLIVNAVKLGGEPEKKEMTDAQGNKKMDSEYSNVRAEIFAGKEGLMTWVKQGGHLIPHKDWIELTRIRYKKDISGRTKVESKDEMLKRGIQSPDVADALALTFAKVKKAIYHVNRPVDPLATLLGGSQVPNSPHGGIGWN